VHLAQLLAEDPLIGSYAPAFCYALDAGEARAEKVRAAFTRDAIRDLWRHPRGSTHLSSSNVTGQ
jgi:hypothetical protein